MVLWNIDRRNNGNNMKISSNNKNIVGGIWVVYVVFMWIVEC